MARTRMVTRTINVTTIEAMCVDTTNAEVSIKELELTGETFTEEKALKVLKKEYETDTFKVVAIQKMEVHEEMYGLKEIDFLKVAQKLDSATRKVLESEEQHTTLGNGKQQGSISCTQFIATMRNIK